LRTEGKTGKRGGAHSSAKAFAGTNLETKDYEKQISVVRRRAPEGNAEMHHVVSREQRDDRVPGEDNVRRDEKSWGDRTPWDPMAPKLTNRTILAIQRRKAESHAKKGRVVFF